MDREPENRSPEPTAPQEPKIEYGISQSNTPQSGFWNSAPTQPCYPQNPYPQNPYQQNPYLQNPYLQNPYPQSQTPPPFVPPTPEQSAAAATARTAKLLGVFSLVAAILCTCLPIVAPILAVIALFKAATAAKDFPGGNADVTCARVCAILGLVLAVICGAFGIYLWYEFVASILLGL